MTRTRRLHNRKGPQLNRLRPGSPILATRNDPGSIPGLGIFFVRGFAVQLVFPFWPFFRWRGFGLNSMVTRKMLREKPKKTEGTFRLNPDHGRRHRGSAAPSGEVAHMKTRRTTFRVLRIPPFGSPVCAFAGSRKPGFRFRRAGRMLQKLRNSQLFRFRPLIRAFFLP